MSGKDSERWDLFAVEAAYADSMFRSAIGDTEGCIQALERAVEIKPDYAPAVLALGSVKYQRERKAEGRKRLLSLLLMPDDTPDRIEIIDEAGDFLIQSGEYVDALKLRPELGLLAAGRYPDCLRMGPQETCTIDQAGSKPITRRCPSRLTACAMRGSLDP